ncbi:MAG: transporter substrate-binding domain-containing protein [Erysipelotrichaceae bacterium]|jgi:putative lysine transport system substrate-binding protein/putative lysine transport system permease protein|uniref:Transporter substrate-binding domain-containing protein n=1 Tax=Grylomicrobium aquisgranensis TaxID=2926318 RepID=A0AB35U5L7_9FIRM|nr:transporter substrate-binding domain-containing protein [Lactimicrobium massiliense]MCH4019962.1 transporter substrate-binding domain-containing protein [Erysipelotrichaceae bacterium]MCI1327051.1 transporter substrate-binding domain-containing protein [Solobacterium sp.]MDX8420279.1 transporter substrate-binding domain-containing protein [Stecheria sp. CLA-KB-P133]MCH4045043.1 transporter substrate-binding domain-containing protein [Erysipelotrichaceae bacterium]MCH4122255.1 transporter su
MKNAIRSVSVSALCAVMLAGCGSGSAAAASASASADANTLRVGMECNYAPYNWTTTEKTDTSQQITSVDYCDGYDVMMAEKLAEKTNKQVKIVKLDWDNLILSLQNNQIDAIIAGMTDTEEREQEVAFTTPYYVSTEVIIVEKDSDLANATSLEDFSGKKVIGQLNTLYDTIIDQIPNVQHQPGAETFPAAIQALQSGAVDAVTSELPVAKGVVEANPDLTYITFEDGKGFTGADKDASVSVAVRKDDKDLLDSLQSALDTISDDEREQMMETAVKNQPASQD